MTNMYKKEFQNQNTTHVDVKAADKDQIDTTFNFRLPSASGRAPPNRLPPLKTKNQDWT